jgi:hypothetical protein
LLGRTTRLVPDAPETPLNPALGPFVSDVVVSGSINGNPCAIIISSTCFVYYTSRSLLFLLNQAVTTPPHCLPRACRLVSPRK